MPHQHLMGEDATASTDTSRRDNAAELCYILVTNSAICSTDDRETTDGKIAHLEEVFEVAEEWLWNARAHRNTLKFPSRFKKDDADTLYQNLQMFFNLYNNSCSSAFRLIG